MKCVVLAGGSGSRLWPLSRNKYPKQFMELNKEHSLFQETILRNQEFCDEFIILTNDSYDFIVEKQIADMDSIAYRAMYEQVGRNTAPAIAMAALLCDEDEIIFVVSSDHLIHGKEYAEAIHSAEKLAMDGNIVVFGLEPKSPHTGYGYIEHEAENVISFKEKPNLELAQMYLQKGNYLWNSGIFMFKAGTFLNELNQYRPDIYAACVEASKNINMELQHIVLTSEIMNRIPSESIDYAVLEHSNKVKVVESSFEWTDIGNLEVISNYMPDEQVKGVIQQDCMNTTVLNKCENKIIIANKLSDVIIINTEDAIYISKKGTSDNIKNIINNYQEDYASFFDDNKIQYRPWGCFELIKRDAGYAVKKITIAPHKQLSNHYHNKRTETWTIVSGEATIRVDDEVKVYGVNETVNVPIGMVHQVTNNTEEDLVIIEASVGSIITEEDIVRI